MDYRDDKFSEKQTARIEELLSWIDEMKSTKGVTMSIVIFYIDRDFNFYSVFNKVSDIDGERDYFLKYIQIDQAGKFIDVGGFGAGYSITPESGRALNDKFGKFTEITETELKNYYAIKK